MYAICGQPGTRLPVGSHAVDRILRDVVAVGRVAGLMRHVLRKAVVRRDALPHLEQVVAALQHDGIHAKAQGPLQPRVLPVGLQHVIDLRAADGRGGIDVGNRATRAGLDRLEPDQPLPVPWQVVYCAL